MVVIKGASQTAVDFKLILEVIKFVTSCDVDI